MVGENWYMAGGAEEGIPSTRRPAEGRAEDATGNRSDRTRLHLSSWMCFVIGFF